MFSGLAQFPFYALGSIEEAMRSKCSRNTDNGIDEAVLRLKSPWFRIIESRLGLNGPNLLSYHFYGSANCCLAVAKV